jgi:hypothetical protein
MLRKPASGWLSDFVDEIAASKLPREQIIALFEEGIGHKDSEHRSNALEGLAGVDKMLFRKHLLKCLQQGVVGMWLVVRADSRECWDAFGAAVKRAPLAERMIAIRQVRFVRPSDKVDTTRRERIRFLMLFLDDRTAGHLKDEWLDQVEVCDNAAYELVDLLRLPVKRQTKDGLVPGNWKLGTISRLVFREAVRRAAQQELARLGK